jgi:hypothetical protein
LRMGVGNLCSDERIAAMEADAACDAEW